MGPEIPYHQEGSLDQRYPTPGEQTDVCENITLTQLF